MTVPVAMPVRCVGAHAPAAGVPFDVRLSAPNGCDMHLKNAYVCEVTLLFRAFLRSPVFFNSSAWGDLSRPLGQPMSRAPGRHDLVHVVEVAVLVTASRPFHGTRVMYR